MLTTPIQIDDDIPMPPHLDTGHYRDALSTMSVGQSFKILPEHTNRAYRAAKQLGCRVSIETYKGEKRVWMQTEPSTFLEIDLLLGWLRDWASQSQGDEWVGKAVELFRCLPCMRSVSRVQSPRKLGKMLSELSRSDCGVKIIQHDPKRGHVYQIAIARLKP